MAGNPGRQVPSRVKERYGYVITSYSIHYTKLYDSEALAKARADELGHMAKINEYIIQHMRTGVLVLDAEQRILMMNNPAWHLLGMPSYNFV